MQPRSTRCSARSGPAPAHDAPPARLLAALAAAVRLPLRVRGGCMAPALADGEIVSVARRRVYWPGDVVAVAGPGGRLLVHRALGYWPGRDGLALLTQADAAARPDQAAPRDAVVGVVVRRGAARFGVRPRERVRAAARLARHLLRRTVARARRA
jgi:hypothetical protein